MWRVVHSVLVESPLLVVQGAGGAGLEPAGDAMKVVRMAAGSEGDVAVLGIVRLSRACDACGDGTRRSSGSQL